jgi:hypothetical protein
VLEDDAIAFGSHEKTNRVDVRERDFLEIERRWSTTRGISSRTGAMCSARMRPIRSPEMSAEEIGDHLISVAPGGRSLTTA